MMANSIEEINLAKDRIEELEKELVEAKTQRDNWRSAHLRRYNQAEVSQQQTKGLREALEDFTTYSKNGPFHVEPRGTFYQYVQTRSEDALLATTPVGETSKNWECCEVCNRMYRTGESCVDCPGFAEPVNTYLDKSLHQSETQVDYSEAFDIDERLDLEAETQAVCPTCHGKKQVINRFQQLYACPSCNGPGTLIPEETNNER